MSVTLRLAVTARAITRDQLGGVAPDDRAAEHDAGGRVGDDLHEPPGVVVDQRLGAGRERHLGDADLAARGERLGLGQADVGDLRLGEDRRGRLVVVEVAVLAGVQAHHVLGDLAPLHRGDRRQRQLPAHVAGGVDVGHVGDWQLWLIGDVAAGVGGDAGGVEPEAVAVRHRADRQHGVGARGRPARRRSCTMTPSLSGSRSMATARAPFSRRTPRSQEVVLQHGRHLGVLARQHLLAGDDERHLGAERREHVHELDAGDAGADDGRRARGTSWAGSSRGSSGCGRRRAGTSPGSAAGSRSRPGRRRTCIRSVPVDGRDLDLVRADEAGRCRGPSARPGCRAGRDAVLEVVA